MEREKIVELYEIAQEKSRGGKLIEYFATLVEQETLERAAQYFDDRGRDKHGNWSTGSYDADSPGIILRTLKASS